MRPWKAAAPPATVAEWTGCLVISLEQKEMHDFSALNYAADAFPVFGTTRAIFAAEMGMSSNRFPELR